MRLSLATLALTASLVPSAAAQCLQYRLDAVAPTSLGNFGLGLDADGARACIGGVGFAAVWERTPLGWTHVAQLPAPDWTGFFGSAVSLRKERILIGGFAIIGLQTTGTARLFENGPGGWSLVAHLSANPSEVGGQFGRSVALGRDFRRSAAGWVQEAKLKPSDMRDDIRFGKWVDVEPGRILVGAPTLLYEAGSAYVFERTAAGWTEVEHLRGEGVTPHGEFGARGVFADGGLLIAAPRTDLDRGAVFVFDDSYRTDYCPATATSAGAAAEIEACGTTSLALGTLRMTCAPVPNQPGVFFYCQAQTQRPFANGFLCVANPSFRLVPTMAVGGVLATNYDLSAPPTQAAQILSGAVWSFQAWFRDPASGGAQANLSNGVELQFIP